MAKKQTFPQKWAENVRNPLTAVATTQCAPDTDWDRDVFIALLPTDADGAPIWPKSMRWAPYYSVGRYRYDDRHAMLRAAKKHARECEGKTAREVVKDLGMRRGEKWSRVREIIGEDGGLQQDVLNRTVIA